MTQGLKEGPCAVFLDRDGTINIDPGYLSDPAMVALLPGAAEAIRRLNEKSILVVVVTNQSGIARGYFSEEDLKAVNDRILELLGDGGAKVDRIYFCPHHPEDNCGCRKPEAGLVTMASTELEVDPGCSYMVGDKSSDMELAERTGAKGVLVLTGDGKTELERMGEAGAPVPAFVATDISVAVDWIIRDIDMTGVSGD